MYSYGCNTTGTTCGNVNVNVNVHNQLNPFTPSSSSMKPKINYYNNRRKDIQQVFTPTNVKSHKSTQKSASVNSVDECSHRKKQIQVNINKEHLHSNSTKQIMNYEEDKGNAKVKKVNEVIQKDKEQIKIKQNDKDDVYKKQLEEEIKKCKLHNENLLKEVERYKKQIQKLIEDNIKLKRINQEQSIIIHKSNVFNSNHNKVTITNELTFTFTPIVKHNQFFINNVKPISSTDELFNTLERDNFALSEQLLTLESQIDLYMKSKSRMNDDYTLFSSNIHNNNNTDRSSNPYNYSLNDNEICSLLYAFYHKLSSLLNKPTIEFDMISYNKKAFILSTSSMLTEIQAYKAFLPKASSSHNNNNN